MTIWPIRMTPQSLSFCIWIKYKYDFIPYNIAIIAFIFSQPVRGAEWAGAGDDVSQGADIHAPRYLHLQPGAV